MKTFAQTLIAALLLSTANFAGTPATTLPTADNPTVTTVSYKVAVFPSATPSHLNVFVEREPGQPMSVLLKTTDGTLLAKKNIDKKQGSLHFQFNMVDLEDGAYTIEINSGSDRTTYPVTLSTKPAQAAVRTITLK